MNAPLLDPLLDLGLLNEFKTGL